jgi:DNA-binding NarL/FixJ family response regulator
VLAVNRQIVTALAGPPGLVKDVVRQLLGDAGVVVVDHDETARVDADVVMVVRPLPEHWPAMAGDDTPHVVVVPERPDDADVVRAVLSGADAVLSFDSSAEDIVTVIEAVSRGANVLESAHVRALVSVARGVAAQPTTSLSRRESEILASIARGESVKQTARALGISPKTVENLQSRLFRKLGVRNRAQAVSRAHELRLLPPP